MEIKSIGIVNTTSGWAVRVRFEDLTERFIVAAAGYTLAQAQMAQNSLERDIFNHGPSMAEIRTDPLPEGCKVVKS